jgi:hypothetical protein
MQILNLEKGEFLAYVCSRLVRLVVGMHSGLQNGVRFTERGNLWCFHGHTYDFQQFCAAR